jgi:hypothetical protein
MESTQHHVLYNRIFLKCPFLPLPFGQSDQNTSPFSEVWKTIKKEEINHRAVSCKF